MKMKAFLIAAVVAAALALPAHAQRVRGGSHVLQGTASQQVSATRGDLLGVYVASGSSCTLKFWNSATNSGAVLVDTFSATAATWYPLPFRATVGIYVTVGGTCSYTVSYFTD